MQNVTDCDWLCGFEVKCVLKNVIKQQEQSHWKDLSPIHLVREDKTETFSFQKVSVLVYFFCSFFILKLYLLALVTLVRTPDCWILFRACICVCVGTCMVYEQSGMKWWVYCLNSLALRLPSCSVARSHLGICLLLIGQQGGTVWMLCLCVWRH